MFRTDLSPVLFQSRTICLGPSLEGPTPDLELEQTHGLSPAVRTRTLAGAPAEAQAEGWMESLLGCQCVGVPQLVMS